MSFYNNENVKEIMGFDLKIDPNIQRLCETSNSSSGSTRSVLYILVLICITSIIAVFNSFNINGSFNWTFERFNTTKDSLAIIQNQIAHYKFASAFKHPLDETSYIDSCKLEKEKKIQEGYLQSFINNQTEKLRTVNLPVIGNSFDINNLAIYSGISLIVILIVLRFSLSREKKNFRIALHAITERYPDPEKYFDEESKIIDVLDKSIINMKDFDISTKISYEFIKNFNLTRRKHHYNFLSMNEVFTLPIDELGTKEQKNEQNLSFMNSPIRKIVLRYLFYFPFWVFLIIFINDIKSFHSGSKLNSIHTYILYFISYLFLTFIAYLCYECNVQKIYTQNYYDDFFRNDFKFFNNQTRLIPLRKSPFIFYPFEVLIKGGLLFITFLFHQIPVMIRKNKLNHKA